MSVITKTPLTTLRDSSTGGAPVYIGGDRLAGEPVATPPEFADDEDPYFMSNPLRRALLTIAHIPQAGAANIDFVTLHLRNEHVTQRAYVNVLIAADISVQIRVDGVPTSSPVYGDMLLLETDGTRSSVVSEMDVATAAIRVSVLASDVYDIAPSVVFVPAPSGLLSATAVLGTDGRVSSISVVEAISHSYTTAPEVRLVGGRYRELGFFVDADDETIVYEHGTAGAISVVSTLCRTQFASNVSAPGDVVILGNEARVVQTISNSHLEFTIDRELVSSTTVFDTWSYIPVATASSQSLLRIGTGLLAVNAVYGSNAAVTSSAHHLAVGDIVFYATNSIPPRHHSHRVTHVVDATGFIVDGSFALTAGETTSWRFMYRLSQENPAVSTSTLASVTRIINVIRTPASEEDVSVLGTAVDVRGLHGRKLWIRNKSYFNTPGSYYDSEKPAASAIAQYGMLAPYHADHGDIPNDIQPQHVLEVVVPPQPSPATTVLSGTAICGGLAGSVGKRPVIAVYQRGTSVRSNTVTMWGDYQRYSPNAISTYTQAINL